MKRLISIVKSLSDFQKILLLFIVWRLVLFAISYLATIVIPKWGGWFPYADRVLVPTKLPAWIWSFGNFDGVHYLKIMQDGYKNIFSQAFFPLFPIFGKALTSLNILIPKSSLDLNIFVDPRYFYNAFLLSNGLFVLALYYLYKLFRLDYSERVSWLSVLLLLVFPTSFYFGAIYTETLFLLLSILCMLMARRKKYLLAGVFAGLASATRILGLALFVVLVIELLTDIRTKQLLVKSRKFMCSLVGVFLAPLGVVAYMAYLKATTGDWLFFLTSQPSFGAERSAKPFILLPQVIYRYIKMFLVIPVNSLQYLTLVNEFLMALVPLTLLVLFFKKIRLSYWFFMFIYLIVPTLTGTFLSMPRFALMSFFLFPLVVIKTGKYFKLLVFLFFILGVILVSLFTRGYWVA